jgi:hypothetical protein
VGECWVCYISSHGRCVYNTIPVGTFDSPAPGASGGGGLEGGVARQGPPPSFRTVRFRNDTEGAVRPPESARSAKIFWVAFCFFAIFDPLYSI